MLPGVSTRVLVVKEPIPPTIEPYTGPPFASGPWHARHFASYTALPSATPPRPGGSPLPVLVRMSMSQGAMSASAMGRPNFASGVAGDRDCVARAQAVVIVAIAITTASGLDDRIGHLPVRAHRPREDRVVMLDEAGQRPRLADLLNRRLHVAGRVDGTALDLGGRAVPRPRQPELRQALVEHGLGQLGLAPVLTAVHRHVDAPDLSATGPGESNDLVRPGPRQSHPTGGSSDDGFRLHHEAELPPLAVRHRIRVTRSLAAEVPRLIADLDATQPLHRHVAFPPRDERA